MAEVRMTAICTDVDNGSRCCRSPHGPDVSHWHLPSPIALDARPALEFVEGDKPDMNTYFGGAGGCHCFCTVSHPKTPEIRDGMEFVDIPDRPEDTAAAPDPGQESPGVTAMLAASAAGVGCRLTEEEVRDVYAEIERLRADVAWQQELIDDTLARLTASAGIPGPTVGKPPPVPGAPGPAVAASRARREFRGLFPGEETGG